MLLKNNELQKNIDALPYSEFKNMAIRYGQNHSINIQDDLDAIATLDFQKRLEKLGINHACPSCGSIHIVKNRKRNHIQRYKCKDCSSHFTLFTNTILEKTKWHWNIWLKMLQLTLYGESIEGIRHIFKKDFHC